MTLRQIAALGVFSCAALLSTGGYFFVWAPNHSGGRLAAFTTDGCSDFPDGTPRQKTLWLNCCIAHDRKYWAGGTAEERAWADHQLETCVAGVGEPAVARVMLAGVRVGGSPWWPTPFRWGYGWPYGRGYRALSAPERDEAGYLLTQFDLRHPPAPVTAP